ncbi:MAG TPA: hypothetical protein PK329_09160 [Myxococcota bacterium]|nr:hypothetical protein [Myxococcota bacterium]HON26445.1 hypothetical protein [Myxococcota bacterium]HOS62597.1 hypothetical protein [Myxococcota bacterium]HPL25721.1 hypothetical protein [Myxococcota bacterium]HQI62165.1 hypothetical protein [Myxococcota bacterium]
MPPDHVAGCPLDLFLAPNCAKQYSRLPAAQGPVTTAPVPASCPCPSVWSSCWLNGIYKDGELMPKATNKKFLLVRTEATRQVKRNIDHYKGECVKIMFTAFYSPTEIISVL